MFRDELLSWKNYYVGTLKGRSSPEHQWNQSLLTLDLSFSSLIPFVIVKSQTIQSQTKIIAIVFPPRKTKQAGDPTTFGGESILGWQLLFLVVVVVFFYIATCLMAQEWSHCEVSSPLLLLLTVGFQESALFCCVLSQEYDMRSYIQVKEE